MLILMLPPTRAALFRGGCRLERQQIVNPVSFLMIRGGFCNLAARCLHCLSPLLCMRTASLS